jgi:hypothetical protein
MTLEQLKQQATATYNNIGRYEVIFTNLFSDFLNQYDALVAKGYIKPNDFDISAYNNDLCSHQTIHMIKPAKVQAAELTAILADVESNYKEVG